MNVSASDHRLKMGGRPEAEPLWEPLPEPAPRHAQLIPDCPPSSTLPYHSRKKPPLLLYYISPTENPAGYYVLSPFPVPANEPFHSSLGAILKGELDSQSSLLCPPRSQRSSKTSRSTRRLASTRRRLHFSSLCATGRNSTVLCGTFW